MPKSNGLLRSDYMLSGLVVNVRCITALFTCVFVIGSCGRVNYCGAKMCMSLDTHTFCQFSPGPGSECIGYIEAQLTPDEKSRLLARLNRRRSEAASGRLRDMYSAGDMMKLRWIEELAKEAQLWANQCRPPSHPEERDECRDLYSVSVGQCITSVLGEAPGLRVESMVDMWYMQSLLYKGNVTSYVPSENDRSFYGDFAQMMWSRSYMVGCGRSRFMVPWQGRLRSVERLVCNISPAGPAPYRALWSPGEPASACPPRSRPDTNHPMLCAYQLKIDESDLNNSMTIEEHVLLNSVLEVEKNESLFEVGSLDELYLTNLAIVTMERAESSTDFYNFDQKGEIVEAIYVDDEKDMKEISRNKKISKSKITMIGRPKPYNMKELTEIGDDHQDDYHEVEYVPKNFNDIYGDYVDTQEENDTAATEAPRIKLKKEFYKIDLNNEDKITPVTYEIYGNETSNETIFAIKENITDISMSQDLEIESSIQNNTTVERFNETLEPKDKSVEDYLADPETMLQLQQALDRMENEKQNKITSKVRRELRGLSVEDGSSTVSPGSDQNATLADRGPMLSMVMKYMPIFKQYEGQLLGSTNSGTRVLPSVALSLWILL